jgi:hypothetical protein|tara:strand:+ start:58 stop:453 length:396 start_codon:yes stop_codon:yes gene_type:complete
MATHGNWTVIISEKKIMKKTGEGSIEAPIFYKITGEDSFWNDSKFDNIHCIHYIDDNNDDNDLVETVPGTVGRNLSWVEANLGDFASQFITKWDAAHLVQLQSNWDNDNVEDETESEKISRLGARPTSYSS